MRNGGRGDGEVERWKPAGTEGGGILRREMKDGEMERGG